jgi:hypothetical protein
MPSDLKWRANGKTVLKSYLMRNKVGYTIKSPCHILEGKVLSSGICKSIFGQEFISPNICAKSTPNLGVFRNGLEAF